MVLKQNITNMTNMHSELDEVNKLIIEMTGSPDLANVWWTSPNQAFDGETPKNVWLKNPEAVQVYVNEIFFGGW